MLKGVGKAAKRPGFDKSLTVPHTIFSSYLLHSTHPSLPLSSPPLFSDVFILPSPFVLDMSAAFFFLPKDEDTQHELFPWPCPVWRGMRERFRTAESLHILHLTAGNVSFRLAADGIKKGLNAYSQLTCLAA